MKRGLAMVIFAVWFRTADGPETIVGITSIKKDAYKMARDLYAIKKNIDGNDQISTGIYMMEPGKLYTSVKAKRAQVTPLLTSMI